MSVVQGAAFAYLHNVSSPVTGNYTTTAGRSLVVATLAFNVSSFDTMTVNSVEMTPIAATFTADSYSLRMYIIESLASSGSMPINFGFTGGGAAVVAIWEIYDDVSGACTNDGYNTGNGTGANPSITVTTGATNSFMIGLVNPGASSAAGTGYTQDTIAWWNFEQGEHKANAGAPGGIVVDWTVVASTWQGIAAGFKAAAVADVSINVPSYMQLMSGGKMIGRRYV